MKYSQSMFSTYLSLVHCQYCDGLSSQEFLNLSVCHGGDSPHQHLG